MNEGMVENNQIGETKRRKHYNYFSRKKREKKNHYSGASKSAKLSDWKMVRCFGIQFIGEALDVGGAPFLAATRRPKDGAETGGLHIRGRLKGNAAVPALGRGRRRRKKTATQKLRQGFRPCKIES